MKAAGFICGLVLAAVVVGWLGTGAWRKASPGTSLTSTSPPATAPATVWSAPRRGPDSPAAPAAMPLSPGESATDSTADTNWENQVDEMLVSGVDDPGRAHQLLELFPTLPEEGQVQLAEQLSFMLTDDDYPNLSRFLVQGSLPEPVLEALLTGALLRSDEIKGPLLLSVAADDRNPKSQEARTLLEDLMGRELGNDPRLWPSAVQAWLQTPRPPPPQ